MNEILRIDKFLACIMVAAIGLFMTPQLNPYSQEDVKEFQKTVVNHTVEEVVKVAKVVDPRHLACMAKNIFYEAGSEPHLGQVAVARVVMNRITHGFGKDPCNVIYQANYIDITNEEGDLEKVKVCQFSWVCEGKAEPSKNSPIYRRAEKIAYEVLAYNAYEDVIPHSTLFFHSTFINPGWGYRQVARIGNHVFYSKGKK